MESENHGRSRPRISVVMSVYNEERYLRHALDSILGQTFRDFEVIIFDDASTDRTPEILDEYAARDSRIRVIRNSENEGATINANKGLKLARGEYIARMDGDDVSLPERFDHQLNFLDSHLDHVVSGTSFHVIDDNGRVLRTDIEATESWEVEWISLFRPPFTQSSVMFRATLVHDHALFYDEAYRTSQDFDMWARMLNYGKGVSLPEPLILYRVHPNAVSVKRRDEQRSNGREIAIKHLYRRFPDLIALDIPVRHPYDLMNEQGPAEGRNLAEIVSAMTAIERRFLQDHTLSKLQKRRMRGLAARWLAAVILRGGAHKHPRSLLSFLLAARGYWLPMLGETADYIARRLSRFRHP